MENPMLLVEDIFGVTIEGEGSHIGERVVYVRLARCDYRCSWCDSPEAVLPLFRHLWHPTSVLDVFEELQRRCKGEKLLITISGGNPALYEEVGDLLDVLHAAGHRCKIETQGSILQRWFSKIDVLSLSPKPPSSGMPKRPQRLISKALALENMVWSRLTACIEAANNAEVYLKIPIQVPLELDQQSLACSRDYLFAKAVSQRYPHLPLYLQPVNLHVRESHLEKVREEQVERLRLLTEVAKEDQWPGRVFILPQLHVLLWGNAPSV